MVFMNIVIPAKQLEEETLKSNLVES